MNIVIDIGPNWRIEMPGKDSGRSDGRTLEGVRMLIAEDDERLAGEMKMHFGRLGADVVRASVSSKVLQLLSGESEYDLVLLDVERLTDDGLVALGAIRSMNLAWPIVVITPTGDREKALQARGVNGYVVKPFNLVDLTMHVYAALNQSIDNDLLKAQIGDLQIDFRTGKAVRGQIAIQLEELELELLRSLLRSRGQVVTRKKLLKDAWGMDADTALFSVAPDVIARTVDRHIQSIRLKIEPDPRAPRFIETVQGLGYRLTTPGS